ncbi:MAG: SurA N-terminal domain-containing protein [Gammaproteobacteria bacterium]|nr:SurA N-terminal domain-containing protein [Gammaproteobacteria bacterium]
MLTAIKERASGWIAWTLVALISIPFALWGINSYFEGASKIVVATVNGVEIEKTDYQNSLSDQRRMLVQMMGQNVDADYFASRAFKLQVLETLIDSRLQAEYLRDRGFRVTDEQLSKKISSFSAFQVDGQFDPTRYEQLVRNAGLSVEGFERQQRQQGAIDQLRAGLRGSSLVVSSMTDRAIELLYQRRVAQFTVVDIAAFEDSLVVGSEALRDEFDANKAQYVQPEQMQVEFIRLSVDELGKQANVSELEQRAFYDNNVERFTQPESRSASHILLSLAEDDAEDVVDTREQEAKGIAARARSGEDFAKLAETYSKDPGSASRGGDLGIIRPGAMAPSFETVVFDLKEGQISDPVRTAYGWHIIKVTNIRESNVRPFDEVMSEIKTILEREWAENQFITMAEDFQNLIFEQPDSLNAASDFLGTPIERSDWFSRTTGDGIASNDLVRDTAFSPEVLVDRLNSEMLEIGSDTLVAVRFADFREKRQKDFNEVKDQIERVLAARVAAEAQEKFATKLVATLESGADWDNLLTVEGLSSADLPEDLESTTDDVARAVARVVYSVGAPNPGTPVFGSARLSATDYLIYKLDEIVAGDISQISGDQVSEVEDLVESRVGEELHAGIGRALRTAADVQIFEEAL